MGPYILVYILDLYPQEGSGEFAERFMIENVMHERVNELARKYQNQFKVTTAALIDYEFKYNAIQKVTVFEPERIK